MKPEMNEAARLTRAGRLAEATALIQRSLGMGVAPAAAHAQFVEGPTIDVTASVVSNSATADASPSSAAEEVPKRSAQAGTEGPGRVSPTPGAHMAPLDVGALLHGLRSFSAVAKPPAPGRARRQFGPEVVAPTAGRWRTGTYTGEAGSRGYKLYLPSNHDSQRLPLVVMLHGCTQSADDFAAGTRMNFLAEAEGLLVVYPEQALAANASRCWNWFQPADQQRGIGEPAIIAGITRKVMAEHNVDPNRVFIAGLSAGGAMAAVLAAVYPEVFAAVGVHSGLAPGNAHDLPSALQAMRGHCLDKQRARVGHTIPLILFHGDRDSTVHPHNAEEFIRQWVAGADRTRFSLLRGQVAGGKQYSCAAYRDSGGRTLVEHWTIHGASHAWSGGSPNGSFTDPGGPDASRELVRFFCQQP